MGVGRRRVRVRPEPGQPLAADGVGDARPAGRGPASASAVAPPAAAARPGGGRLCGSAVCVDGGALVAGAAHQLLRVNRRLGGVLALRQPQRLRRRGREPQRGMGRPVRVSRMVRHTSAVAVDAPGLRAGRVRPVDAAPPPAVRGGDAQRGILLGLPGQQRPVDRPARVRLRRLQRGGLPPVFAGVLRPRRGLAGGRRTGASGPLGIRDARRTVVADRDRGAGGRGHDRVFRVGRLGYERPCRQRFFDAVRGYDVRPVAAERGAVRLRRRGDRPARLLPLRRAPPAGRDAHQHAGIGVRQPAVFVEAAEAATGGHPAPIRGRDRPPGVLHRGRGRLSPRPRRPAPRLREGSRPAGNPRHPGVAVP